MHSELKQILNDYRDDLANGDIGLTEYCNEALSLVEVDVEAGEEDA